MSLARIHNFAISLDGFGTGEGQGPDAHFGHAGDRLHQWMFATRWWGPGGSGGVDDAFVQRHDPGIASPAEALETAREAAGGQDVRIGGGPTVIRDFLAAGLVDYAHIVVVPILLGRGVRLWDGLEGVENDYQVEATSSPSGVTHVTFTRAGSAHTAG
jgi:RibD C-terminal domain